MKNIYKWLSRIERLFLLVLLIQPVWLIAQRQEPVTPDEVQSLKSQQQELWYVDKRFDFSESKTKNNEADLKKVSREEPSSISINPVVVEIFKYFAWFVAGAAILGAIYLITKNLKGFTAKSNEEVGEVISEETQIDSAEELGKIAYERQIQLALQQNNYRLAVRLYYLWTLQKLSQAGLIDFHAHKTNLDYCQEIQSNELLPIFKQCTRFYDYVWFGNFNINPQTFGAIEATFKELLKEKV